MQDDYDVAVIGGGILGCSIAYFLSMVSVSSVILIEQENNVGMHTSSRNTGKVHAPLYYSPTKRESTAKYALKGFDMLKHYCKLHKLPFKEDGVIEVAIDENEIEMLHRHIEWGYKNGLNKDELKFLNKEEVLKIEPNVKCHSAIVCFRDASTDYGLINQKLMEDAISFGCNTSFRNKFKSIYPNINASANRRWTIVGTVKEIKTDYIINATGGNSLDIAHSVDLAKEYVDLHFRGEYWIAPQQYSNLTKRSIYAVPKYPEYPFLDPHWIIRDNGKCEVGPNAVPVFGPYAYNWSNNLKNVIPKIYESSKVGILKLFLNKEFLKLVSEEFSTSFFKTKMINRVRRFLPSLKPSEFKLRGRAGIRSSLIDRNGNFVADNLFIENEYSLHILNYNSPGATGALPVAVNIVKELIQKGVIRKSTQKVNTQFIDEFE